MSEQMWLGGLIGGAVAFLLVMLRLSTINQRLNRLSVLDAKVDALLKAGKVKFDPFLDVPADVREALARGQTIDAIRQYRIATGVGLKEAKEFVDEVRRRDNSRVK